MWNYNSSLGSRIKALTAPTNLDAIASRIASEGKVICAHAEPCDLDRRFVRAVYCAYLDPMLFDLFFNSWSGYRAAYFRSTEEGQKANARLLSRLSPELQQYHPVGPSVDAAQSLKAPSAKAWLAEVARGLCSCCASEWKPSPEAPAEILNGRWELSPDLLATFGRAAPLLRKLRVFGGFVNEHGQELVPPAKVRRAQDIHDWGWS
ncbi:MAG: hypothetical protein EXQ52_08180 [Bryobacterales bacterium]|nr:hypothetical protein [Bryobacterales bacterium]